MTLYFRLIVMFLLLAVQVQAHEDHPWQAEVELGLTLREPEFADLGSDSQTDYFRSGFSAGLEFGYRVLPWLTPYVSVQYLQNRLEYLSASNIVAGRGTDNAIVALANASFEWQWEILRPFIAGGVGFGHLETHQESEDGAISLSGDQIAFAWQASVGLRVQIIPVLFLGLSYQFLNIVGPKFDIQVNDQLYANASKENANMYHNLRIQLGANF